MSIKKTLLKKVNSVLNAVNLHALPVHEYRTMLTTYKGADLDASGAPGYCG